MFDVGFSEMLVIAVVALVVIGPERLPKVARTLGHLLGRMQRYVAEVKADISRQMQVEELRSLKDSVQQTAHSIETSVTAAVGELEQALQPPPEPSPDPGVKAAPAESPAATPEPAVPHSQLELPFSGSPRQPGDSRPG